MPREYGVDVSAERNLCLDPSFHRAPSYAWRLSRRVKWLLVARDVRRELWEHCPACQASHMATQHPPHGEHGRASNYESQPGRQPTHSSASVGCRGCTRTSSMAWGVEQLAQALAQRRVARSKRRPWFSLEHQELRAASAKAPIGHLITAMGALPVSHLITAMGALPVSHLITAKGALRIQPGSAPSHEGLQAPRLCFHPVEVTAENAGLIAHAIDRHFFRGGFHAAVAAAWGRSDLPLVSADASLPPWLRRSEDCNVLRWVPSGWVCLSGGPIQVKTIAMHSGGWG